MKRVRRVGTVTAGAMLIIFGVLFLLRLFTQALNYSLILSLWPVILISLGVELLLSHFAQDEETIKYDAGAVVILVLAMLLCIMMAGSETILQRFPELIR